MIANDIRTPSWYDAQTNNLLLITVNPTYRENTQSGSASMTMVMWYILEIISLHFV